MFRADHSVSINRSQNDTYFKDRSSVRLRSSLRLNYYLWALLSVLSWLSLIKQGSGILTLEGVRGVGRQFTSYFLFCMTNGHKSKSWWWRRNATWITLPTEDECRESLAVLLTLAGKFPDVCWLQDVITLNLLMFPSYPGQGVWKHSAKPARVSKKLGVVSPLHIPSLLGRPWGKCVPSPPNTWIALERK